MYCHMGQIGLMPWGSAWVWHKNYIHHLFIHSFIHSCNGTDLHPKILCSIMFLIFENANFVSGGLLTYFWRFCESSPDHFSTVISFTLWRGVNSYEFTIWFRCTLCWSNHFHATNTVNAWTNHEILWFCICYWVSLFLSTENKPPPYFMWEFTLSALFQTAGKLHTMNSCRNKYYTTACIDMISYLSLQMKPLALARLVKQHTCHQPSNW